LRVQWDLLLRGLVFCFRVGFSVNIAYSVL
jgi:hypothetical protein